MTRKDERSHCVVELTPAEARLVREGGECAECGHLNAFHTHTTAEGWYSFLCVVPGCCHFEISAPVPRDIPKLRELLARKRPWWRFW